MNKTLKMALGMVLTVGFMSSALAQDQFPDVPENHWAYEALANMKKNGLLVGYPDGLFRGPRPATRYEMAVAIHATYQYLKNITDNLAAEIAKMGKDGYDHKGLEDALKALQADVAAMKGWGDDIANLKKMAATFEKELASLGVDVEAMKKDLKDLNDRVTKLEKNALPITIHGDVTFFAQHGKGNSGRLGLGTDGQFVGGTADDPSLTNRASGLGDGLSVFHEANLKIAGVNEEGPKWHAVLSIGNLFNGYGNRPVRTAAGAQRNDEASTDILFRRLVAEFDQSLVGQNFSAKVGRLGYKISPYIYMAPDTNPYHTSEYENGEWTMDGALLGFHFGSASLNIMFGRTDNRNSTNGIDAAGVTVGRINGGSTLASQGLLGYGPSIMLADTTFGAHLNVPLGENGTVDLAYLIHSRNTPTPGAFPAAIDAVHVFGADVNFKLNDTINLNGGYSQSNIYLGSRSIVTRDNFAWHLMADYDAERWGLGVGYREIQPNFGAAGSWGRLGSWWNPVDIKGFHVKGHFDLNDNMTLTGSGEWVSGLGKTYRPFTGAPLVPGLRTSDRITSYKIDLDYKMESGWNWMLGAEWVDFKPSGGGDRATQRWYTLGLGYNLSDNAMLRMMWQVSDADARTSGLFASPVNGNGRFTGNLITTQLTIKF